MPNGKDLVSTEEMKKHIPKWLIGFGGSLMFISIFINSIGFNLMSINSALTDHVIAAIESKTLVIPTNPKLLERIRALEAEVKLLKKDSHSPMGKGDR